MVSPDGVIRERSLPTVNPGTGPYQWGNCDYTWWCNQGMKTISIGSALVLLHGQMPESRPDCESRCRDAMVETKQNKTKTVAFHSGFHPTGEKSADCESKYGVYHRGKCAWHRGYTRLVKSGSVNCWGPCSKSLTSHLHPDCPGSMRLVKFSSIFTGKFPQNNSKLRWQSIHLQIYIIFK